MTTPAAALSISQPTQALYQSIVLNSVFPSTTHGASGAGSADSIGFIIQTAFDPDRVSQLITAQGQAVAIDSTGYTEALYALISNLYGGNAITDFLLPDLRGAAPIYLTPPTTSPGQDTPLYGQTVGNPSNSIELTQGNLPSSLGGQSKPFDNAQYSLGMQYLINVSGEWPISDGPTSNTLGTIYAFAGDTQRGPPDGFLPADGRLLNISEFNGLYELLGTTYGGDGRNTFALPDLRHRMPVGVGTAQNGWTTLIGEEIGLASVGLLNSNLPGDGAIFNAPVRMMSPSLGLHYAISTEGAYETLSYSGNPMLGQVVLFAGRQLPEGWTPAHGQILPIQDNPALFSLMGDAFGGDGQSTFGLPDLRGRTAIGVDESTGLLLGHTQGNFELKISSENLPTIVVPVPGVQLMDGAGQSIDGKVTGEYELDISGVWPVATVEFSTDGTTWSQSFDVQEGSNTLYVRQISILGQPSAASEVVSFVLDTTYPAPPEVSVERSDAAASMMFAARSSSRSVSTHMADTTQTTEAAPTVQKTASGKLLFEGVEPGARLEFSVDGGQSWSDSFAAKRGYNAVQVRQVDVAGNASEASDVLEFEWEGSYDDPAVVSISTNSDGGSDITVQQHGKLALGLGTDSVDLLIYGHQQDVSLPQDIEHVRLTDNGLNNTVTGNDRDNVFEVMVGNWIIEGQAGEDKVTLSNALSDYVITQESHDAALQATLLGPEGRIIVRDVQTIEFSDATLVKTTGALIEQVDHLYEELLGRSPDYEGLSFWVEQMKLGASLQDIATGFAESAEFGRLYGTLSATELVEELYEAILDRAPDAEGESFWVEALAVGAISPGELIVELLLSPESQALSVGQLSEGGLYVLA